jgi:hypothetical protein
LRRLPAGSEPPYDDDPAGTQDDAVAAAEEESTAPRNLAASPSTTPPAPPRQRSHARVHRPRRGGGQTAGTLRAVDGTDSRLQPSPQSAATAVTRAILEVLSGSRPAAHLAGWMTPAVHLDIERATGGTTVRRRYSLRSVRVSEPRAGAAEVTAVIGRGDRVAALALRMESSDGRWRVNRLVVG